MPDRYINKSLNNIPQGATQVYRCNQPWPKKWVKEGFFFFFVCLFFFLRIGCCPCRQHLGAKISHFQNELSNLGQHFEQSLECVGSNFEGKAVLGMLKSWFRVHFGLRSNPCLSGCSEKKNVWLWLLTVSYLSASPPVWHLHDYTWVLFLYTSLIGELPKLG